MTKRIMYKGKNYNSYYHLCKENDIPSTTFYKRLKKGWTLEECINGRNGYKKPVEFRGVTYASYRDLCNKYKIPYSKFLSRKNTCNWSIEECIFGKNEGLIHFEGKRYRTFLELCREKKINYSTFILRKNSGFTLEEAVYGKKKGIEFEGDKFSSLKDLCSKYGVNYGTFLSRKANGYSLTECIYGKEKEISKSLELKIESTRDIKYEGKIYSSYKELCDGYNVNYDLFIERMIKGWYIDDCIYGRVSDDNSPGIEYNGVVYKSLKRLCEKYGINFQKFQYRINTLGWSLGKALRHKDEPKRKFDGIYYIADKIKYN